MGVQSARPSRGRRVHPCSRQRVRERGKRRREKKEGTDEGGSDKRKTEIDELDVKRDTNGQGKEKQSKGFQANVLEENLKSGDGNVDFLFFFIQRVAQVER